MIELYTGLIGSGKTYSAVCRMVEYISDGGLVVTNILLNEENLKKKLTSKYAWELQPGQIIYLQEGDRQMARFHEQVPEGSSKKKVLVVVDEATEWLDAYDFGKADSDLMTFLRQSRKVFVDIIFITQDQSLINKRVRTLCAWIWWHIDIRTFKLPLIRLCIPLPMIMAMQFDKWKNMVNRKWEWIDHDIFTIYDSFQVYRSIGLKQGVVTDFGKSGRKKTMTIGWKLAVICSYIVIAFFIVSMKKAEKYKQQELEKRITKIETKTKSVSGSFVDNTSEPVKVENGVVVPEKEKNWQPAIISDYWEVEIAEGDKVVKKFGCTANGRSYEVGKSYVYGKCIACNESTVAFADTLNKRIFFLRDNGEMDRVPVQPRVALHD